MSLNESNKCARCWHKKPINEYKLKRNGKYQKVCNKCLLNMKIKRDAKNKITKIKDDRKQTDLQKCSYCHTAILMKYFSRKKNNSFYKTCDRCRTKIKERYDIKMNKKVEEKKKEKKKEIKKKEKKKEIKKDSLPLKKPVLKRQIAKEPRLKERMLTSFYRDFDERNDDDCPFCGTRCHCGANEPDF